jgi:TetR/AcrR family transcriptional repressor of nem operon
VAGFGIAELMKEAGLTVGGFYKHFGSRDELVAEVVGAAFGTWQRQKEASQSGRQPLFFAKLVDDYVSDAHCKNPGMGCAFSALVGTISLARAVSDEALSRESLKSVGALLNNPT